MLQRYFLFLTVALSAAMFACSSPSDQVTGSSLSAVENSPDLKIYIGEKTAPNSNTNLLVAAMPENAITAALCVPRSDDNCTVGTVQQSTVHSLGNQRKFFAFTQGVEVAADKTYLIYSLDSTGQKSPHMRKITFSRQGAPINVPEQGQGTATAFGFNDLNLTAGNGESTTLYKVFGNAEYAIVDFSSPTCGYCFELARDLLTLENSFKGKCRAITGISSSRGFSAWASNVGEERVLDHTYAPSDQLGEHLKLNFRSTPTTFIIDRQGKVLHGYNDRQQPNLVGHRSAIRQVRSFVEANCRG